MGETAKRATMRQVAKLVGVSAMTVSKALGNKTGVSEETRKRVLAAAEQLRYTPNMLAKCFRTDQTNTIGVIMSSNFEEVFTILFRGIESEAAAHGLSTLVATSGEDFGKKEEIIQLLVGKRVDGIVLTSPHIFTERERLLLENAGIPYVLAIRSSQDTSISTVVNNNYMGGFAMVDYLAGTGSRRFLFLALTQQRCSSRERLLGWSEGLAAHNLEIKPQNISYVEPTVDCGYEQMRRHLARGRKWDTVVCGSDQIAVGAMEALLEAGIEIPGQIRISGYDGIPLSAYLRIPLTTIQQPLYEIGQTSMRLLAAKIADPATSPQQVVINGKLVVRKST